MARPQGLEVSYEGVKSQVQALCENKLSMRKYGVNQFLKKVGMTYRQWNYLKIANRISKMSAARLILLGNIVLSEVHPTEVHNEVQQLLEMSKKNNKNPLKKDKQKTKTE